MKHERIMLFVLTIGIQLTLCWAGKQYLNEYIKHYEGLSYNTETLHNKHVRAKRSVDSKVNLHFFAHGRDFHLRLKRDTTTFSADAQLQNSDGRLVDLDVSHIYEGQVVGEPDSYVHGSIIQGIFSGNIRTRRATYFVDKTETYFTEPQKFHSVIYSEDDMVMDPYRHKRDAERGTCGATNLNTREWMESVQKSVIAEEHVEKRDLEHETRERLQERTNIYTAAQNRDKRAVPHNKLVCNMFLQSDPMLWDYMTRETGNGGLGYDEARANDEIISLLSTHASGIKLMYEATNFEIKEQDMSYNPVSFVVHRIQVNNTKKVCSGANKPPFCDRYIDAHNFLDLASRSDYSDFCLAYVFTYRDFAGGVIGMAWRPSPTITGGICATYKPTTDQTGTTVYKTLNTGLISLLNFGHRIPLRVSTITFAHEVGHSFGSPHDSGVECTPYSNSQRDPNGNYIMYASATNGDKKNNDKFSPCSIRDITLMIDAVVNEKNGKINCFKQKNDPFCGNKIVEDGETCDCGYDDADCGEDDLKCCIPSDQTNACKLRSTAKCSQTNGPCCNSTCGFIESGMNHICAAATECSYSVTCNGTSEMCPETPPMNDTTPCNGNTQSCWKGTCSRSICKKIGENGWDQCYKGTADRSKMCYVACINPVTKECVSSADKDEIAKRNNTDFKELLDSLNKENIRLRPGAPCDNYQGYCDFFQNCRGVASDGPLARLKNFLSTDKAKDWLIKYWWVVALAVVGVVVVLVVLLKVCAIYTPSSNPNRKPHRKLRLPRSKARATQYAGSQGGNGANPNSTHDNAGFEMQ